MTKADQTRQFILEKTAPLFNSKGYDGTSLSDLTRTTGLTKGSLYGNFRDKGEIAREAFRYSIEKVREKVRKQLEEASTPREQLFALLDFYAHYVFHPPVPGGCPLLNAAVETDDNHSSMRKTVARELVETVNFIALLLDKGVQDGQFKAEINTVELAYTFFCSIEGAIMFSRAERSREPMDIIIRHCRKILNDISK